MARGVDNRISLEKCCCTPFESENGHVCLVSYEPTERVSAETAAKVSCTLVLNVDSVGKSDLTLALYYAWQAGRSSWYVGL